MNPWKRKEVIGNATLYLGDCLEILPALPKVDAVITDPPYPDWLTEELNYNESQVMSLDWLNCRQLVFWSAKENFPLSYSAIHIWHKTGAGCAASYERIFERNGRRVYKVFTGNCISNTTMARFARDQWYDHPTQKPISLMRDLLGDIEGDVLDPFMGSGTTGAACMQLNRKFIGVEIEPKYFDIACERIENAQRQERLFA